MVGKQGEGDRWADHEDVELLQQAFLKHKPETSGAARRISPASSDDESEPARRPERRVVASRFNLSEGDFAQSLSRRLEKGLAGAVVPVASSSCNSLEGGASQTDTATLGSGRRSESKHSTPSNRIRCDSSHSRDSARERRRTRRASSFDSQDSRRAREDRLRQPRTLLSLLHMESASRHNSKNSIISRHLSQDATGSSRRGSKQSLRPTSAPSSRHSVKSNYSASPSSMSSINVAGDTLKTSSPRGDSDATSTPKAPPHEDPAYCGPYACRDFRHLQQGLRTSPVGKADDLFEKSKAPPVSPVKLKRPASAPSLLPQGNAAGDRRNDASPSQRPRPSSATAFGNRRTGASHSLCSGPAPNISRLRPGSAPPAGPRWMVWTRTGMAPLPIHAIAPQHSMRTLARSGSAGRAKGPAGHSAMNGAFPPGKIRRHRWT